jgi:hypothetical protein
MSFILFFLACSSTPAVPEAGLESEKAEKSEKGKSKAEKGEKGKSDAQDEVPAEAPVVAPE